MKKHLALALLICLGSGSELYAKPEKMGEFDSNGIYIYRGITRINNADAIVIDQLTSSIKLGTAFATNYFLSYLPLGYLLGTDHKCVTWYITGPSMSMDAVNLGIKTMNIDIIKAGLSYAKEPLSADLITEFFVSSAENTMASARQSYVLSGVFAYVAYKFSNHAAPLLNELMPKLVGEWLWKYGVVNNPASKLLIPRENKNDITIDTARKESHTVNDKITVSVNGNTVEVVKHIPAALIALNAIRAYQASEQTRAAIIEIAETLLQSDKIDFASRPDLIAAIRAACNNVLADSIVTGWSAKNSLNRVISRVASQRAKIA